MTTKDLLQEAFHALNEGDEATARLKVVCAYDCDTNNMFQAQANRIYSHQVNGNEKLAVKFMEMCKEQRYRVTTSEKKESNGFRVNPNFGFRVIRLVLTFLLLLLVVLVFQQMFTLDIPKL